MNAVTADHIAALVRKATRMALEGNLTAMRIVFERTSGKAAEVQPETEPIPMGLPPLMSASDCAKATDSVLDGICKGVLDRETARVMLEGIQTRLKAIEAQDLEGRIAQMEPLLQTVDAKGARQAKRGIHR